MMKLIRHLTEIPTFAQGCVATIGNFDGVHVGHRQVIQQVKSEAQRLQLPSVVISFEPLPTEYFRRPPPTRITPFRDKARLLNTLQLDYFVCLPFNHALASMEAEDFVETILLRILHVRYLVVGDDFRFGRQRRGDYALLKQLGQLSGMDVVDTHTVLLKGERVSSTRIRTALAQADLTTATTLLGQAYQLSGRVRHGDKRGRTLGFPTLNLRIPEHIALRKGVYLVRVMGLGETVYYGVGNIGARPTVQGLQTRFEVHLFDFNAQVYQQHVCVEPLHFLRDEQRFSSLNELQAQIRCDVEQAQGLLHSKEYNS